MHPRSTLPLRALLRQQRSHKHNTLRNPTSPIDVFVSSSSSQRSAHRTFTQRPSLLLIARTISRPQLPFLHPSTSPSPSAISSLFALTRSTNSTHILNRFISTERRKRWKARLWWQIRFHAYFWPSLFLVLLLGAGVQHTKLERDYPTPRDWSFTSRWYLRAAKHAEHDQGAKVARVLTDWGAVGYYYRLLLERLENMTKGSEGEGLVVQGDGGILVEGVGLTGFDLENKSEQWKKGYYEALMGAAKTAEHLDGMCRRTGEERGKLYPRESVPGPNNPRPKPLPWDKKGGHENIPSELEVEDAFPAPEAFYMKILTTKGFDNRQRLDAALAYADWCGFKGMTEMAQYMHDWALDIAAGGLPHGANNVVDIRTGVINKDKDEWASENLLKATTALAVHHANRGEVKEALPIFLSVLRARRSLPPQPAVLEERNVANADKGDDNGLWPYLYALKDLIIERPYPAASSSGDERPYHTLKEACEEVGVMLYIGEILFATSETEKEKGLSWTRDSVEAAEAVLWLMDEQKKDDGNERCRECLEAGLENWMAMVRQMSSIAGQKRTSILNQKTEPKSSTSKLGLGWLTGGSDADVFQKADEEVKRWEEEEIQIELKRQKTLPLIQPIRPNSSRWVTT